MALVVGEESAACASCMGIQGKGVGEWEAQGLSYVGLICLVVEQIAGVGEVEVEEVS